MNENNLTILKQSCVSKKFVRLSCGVWGGNSTSAEYFRLLIFRHALCTGNLKEKGGWDEGHCTKYF